MRRPLHMHAIGLCGDVFFALFTLLTLVGVFAGQLVALPFDPYRKTAAAIGRWTWGVLHFRAQPFWRTTKTGFERIGPGPYVVVANHQSMLDIPLLMQLPMPVRVVARPGVARMPVFGLMASFGGHVFLDPSSAETVKAGLDRCKALLAEGISVVVFPEGTRSEDGRLQPFARGAFQIALESDAAILPVCITGTRDALPKGRPYGFLPISRIHLQVLDPLPPGGKRRSLSQTVQARLAAAIDGPRPWQLAAMVGERYRPLGRWREGWARGKTSFDPVFWQLWERLPTAGTLVDVGAGEGLLGAYLAAGGSALEFRGLDVDHARAAVARAVGLDVAAGDARTAALPACDAIVAIDVLHYLAPAEQEAVLRRMCAALRPGGTLIVRDPVRAGGLTAAAERLMVAVGRHAGEGVRVLGPERVAAILREHLVNVRIEGASAGTPFANALVSGRSPDAAFAPSPAAASARGLR